MRSILISIALLLVVACSPVQEPQVVGTQEDLITGADNSAQPQAQQTAEQTIGAQPESVPQAKQTESSAEESRGRLKSIMGMTSEYKVTYDVVGNELNGEMTQFIKPGKFRTDMMAEGMDTRTYLIGDSYTVCFKQDDWMCQKMEYKPSAQDTAQNDVRNNIDESDVKSMGARTIAGVSADCFLVSASKGQVEYCYSSDYVPLYIKSMSAVSVEMTAKSYSTSVSDSDFIPPAEPAAAIDYSQYMP